MSLSTEQGHMRFLAIVLPCLTFCTHSLLALSFILPGSDLDHAYLSVAYNVLACCASILGLVGAVRSLPSLVSAYTLVHTMTLSFATLALVNMVLPWSFRVLNPVTPSYAVDESSLCRDIDAGFGWDTEWLQKCSRGLTIIKFGGAGVGMLLMLAQWWALLSVRTWGQELRSQRHRAQQGDVEKAGLVSGADTTTYDEKTGL